jgi:hypothetical protein
MMMCPVCLSEPVPVSSFRSDKSGGMDCECRRLTYYNYDGTWAWFFHVGNMRMDFIAIMTRGDGSHPVAIYRVSSTSRNLVRRPLEGGFPGVLAQHISNLRDEWTVSKVMCC